MHEPKPVTEMAADFLRETGMLVFVFGSLDKLFAEDPKDSLTWGWVSAIVGLGLASWVLGVVLERKRS